MQDIEYKQVPFDIMLKCDGDIKCEHWLLDNSINMYGVDLRQPMHFSEFLLQIGMHLTSINCKSIFQQAKWYVIDDGVQPDYFLNVNENKKLQEENRLLESDRDYWKEKYLLMQRQ